MSAEDLTGNRYERLTVLYRSSSRKYFPSFRGAIWVCQCDCGNICDVPAVGLKTGRIRSCGCLRSEAARRSIDKNRKVSNMYLCHGEELTVKQISERYNVSINTIYYWIRESKDLDTALDDFLKRRLRRNEHEE